MRCKTCDYTLWNLKARQCPECGTPFVPSQFDFVLNSVQFCCPHCDQAYYGTTERGHLVPYSFTCVTCHQQINMDMMVLRPATGVREEQTQINRMPWLEREQRGLIKAWLRTVGDSLLKPGVLMSSVPPESGLGAAWGYAALTTLVLMLSGLVLPLGMVSAIMTLANSRDALEPLLVGLSAAGIGFVTILLVASIWPACAHATLRLTGRTAGGIGRTYECFLYSIGALAPMAIPCVGPYCGSWLIWIWWVVAATFMLVAGQKVGGVRATFAVATLPVALGVLALGGYLALLFAIFSNPARFGGTAMMPTGEVRYVAQQLRDYAIARNGSGPNHVIEMIGPNFSAIALTSSLTNTDATQISLGSTTLDKFDYFPPNTLKLEQQAVVNALPPNVIAHRCGDFVFTYHGIDFIAGDPNLWIVVYSPDPDANGTLPASTNVPVEMVGGMTMVMPPALPQVLALQNQLRAKYNLPPLPLPETVTHSKPAVPKADVNIPLTP